MHTPSVTNSLCFSKSSALPLTSQGWDRLDGSSQFSRVGWRCPRGPAQRVMGPSHCLLVPTQRKGRIGSWGLLPCLTSCWPLASFSRVLLGANATGVQAHLLGTRRGATPLTFKQLPPRSRRPPCRKGERHIKRFNQLNPGTNLCIQ